MIANHLKARIRADKPSFGALLNFGDPLVAEMMAAVGYEWLMVDTEHGPIDLATLGDDVRHDHALSRGPASSACRTSTSTRSSACSMPARGA